MRCFHAQQTLKGHRIDQHSPEEGTRPHFITYTVECDSIQVPLEHLIEGQMAVWRDGSAVKSTDCSSKGSEFKSQHPHGGLQPSLMRPDALFQRASDLIMDGCEPPCGCWDLNSEPLEEQSVLLTAEPSLQPLAMVSIAMI